MDDPAKRIVAVIHRRAGKSTGLMWMGFKKALTCNLPNPRAIHILPYGIMWKRTGLFDQAALASRSIPGAVVNKNDLAIKFPNGSTWQAGGADNPDSWRGGYADHAVVDEYDDTPVSLVPLVIEPMLADRGGILVRSGTPKGNGLLQAAYDRAKVTPGYSSYFLDYRRTGALSDEAIAMLRQEMSKQEFAQELECSFEAPNSGSYYGELMQAAETDGRITIVPYDPLLRVSTAWDLGIDDSTAIWCIQISKSGQWRFIDYIEHSGVALDYYVKQLQARPYVYERHLLPHDAEVRELGTGKSRTETLRGLGVTPITIVPAQSVADGINAVRMILPKAWFDAAKCAPGIKALRSYRREWNEGAQTWRSAPVHDFASHASDSIRYAAMGLRDTIKAPPVPARRSMAPAQGTGRWMG